jgi:hypothetical protein
VHETDTVLQEVASVQQSRKFTLENEPKVSNNCQVPRSRGQKLAKKAARMRKVSGPRIYGALSAKDLDFLFEDYEKRKREATMRALDGLSLDPRQCRRASQLPPPAPG